MSLVRFYRLGLVTNPFCHDSPVPGKDPGPGTRLGEELLEADWRVLQLRGRRGAGKTHLLEWLTWHLARRGHQVAYLHLDEGFSGKVSLPARGVEILALDEAQRARPRDLVELSRWVGQDLSRRLLLATHEDLAGFLVPHRVRQEEVSGVSRRDLDLYLERRLTESSLPDRTPALVFPEETRQRLIERAQQNFLRLIDLLYQVCEELPTDGLVTPAQVERAATRLPLPPPDH